MWLLFGNSDTYELTLGINVSLFAVAFYRIVEISILFRLQKYPDGTWAVCGASKSNSNFTEDTFVALITNFTIGYYCQHIILFEPSLMIRLRFDIVPTTEVRHSPMLRAARAPAIQIFSLNAKKTYREMKYVFTNSLITQ